MLCMTFHGSVSQHNSLLAASNCSDLRSVKVKGAYYFMIITRQPVICNDDICVCVGWIGSSVEREEAGTRPPEPEPGC